LLGGAGVGILRRVSPVPPTCRGITALVIAAALTACGGARPLPGVPPPIGGPAGGTARTVALELPRLDGTPARLSDFRGRVVLVHFFTTWCTPCLEEIPVLDDLAHGEQALPDFVVLGVSLDTTPEALLPPFIELLRIRFPVLLADRAMLQGQTPFGALAAIPASFLIDPQGRHVETYVGLTPVDHLRRRVRSLAEGGR
jgi:peroxiredoxin